MEKNKNNQTFATETQIIDLIKKGFSYTDIQAQLRVSSSRISLVKKKMILAKKEEAREEARKRVKQMILELENMTRPK